VVVIAALVGSWLLLSGGSSSNQETASASVMPEPSDRLPASLQGRLVLPATPQKPRPTTLNPATFASNPNPEIAASYQVAKEIPEVLEYMPCYCGCFGTAGHRNNLDCFRDNHGITCSLCRAIALEAKRQHELGTPVQQIKRIVDERWAPRLR
jgi:hypothetical protein